MKFNKKKPVHFREKEKKDTREVLSYEQLPLDDYEKENIKKPQVKLNKKKLLIAAAILVALVLSVLAVFGGMSIFSCAGNSSENFNVQISGSTVTNGNFRLFSKGLSYVSDTSFVYINNKGEEQYKAHIGYSAPVLKVADDIALIYDLGGKGFSICSDVKVEYSGEAKDNIYLGDITSDSSYALVTETNGYNSKLSVYNPEHQLKYTYSFSEYYITSMALNENATGAVVCGISADNGTEISMMYVLDFTEEEPVAKHKIRSDLIFDCDYLSTSSVCAIGSHASYIANGSKFSKLSTVSYNQMTLTAYDINSQIGSLSLSLSRSGDGRNCSIEYINASAKSEKTIETDLKISSISSYKDRIAVSDNSTLTLYDNSGEVISSAEIPAYIVGIRLGNLNSVYMLGLSDILGLGL
ncbi:MAG: DUF5711 family protein [Ruminococcus sp.]